jgi:hypothetical protein
MMTDRHKKALDKLFEKIHNGAVSLANTKRQSSPGLWYVITLDGQKMFFDEKVDLLCLYDRYMWWNRRFKSE